MDIERMYEDPISFKGHTVQNIFKQSIDVDGCRSSSKIASSDIAELTESLILCSAASVNPNLLELLNISCVVNAAPELPDTPLHRDNILYYRMDIMDSVNSRILIYFDHAADLVHKVAASGGKTLVYCVAGVSRSATICLAYLMKYHGLTLLEAYNYVKSRRPKIKPNCSFFKQLMEFENKLFRTNTVKLVFNNVVQMEIPEVYDKEYQFPQHNKRRSLNARY